jgi:methylglutaconyl-CoA hydratase
MSLGYVTSHIDHNGVNIIEFFHPQSNSLPGKLLEELAQTIHGAGNDDDTKVIVLRSAGEKVFCAGASFDELIAIKNHDEGLQFFSGFAHVINAMRKCPQFILPVYRANALAAALVLPRQPIMP